MAAAAGGRGRAPARRCCAAARSSGTPQVRANGILVESDHGEAGRLRQARPAGPRFSETDFQHVRGAPALGEHTGEVLREAGFGADEIADLAAAGVFGATAAGRAR